jgi:hypothetical protein
VIRFTATDPVPLGGQASGIKGVYYRINNGVTQNGVQATITTRGASNKLEFWTEDYSGNISSRNIVTGIKVETNPPQPLVVAPLIGRNYVNFRDVTMNMSGVNLIGYGVQLQYSGNLVNPVGGAVPYLRAFFPNEVIRLTSGDGTKNVSILFQGQYVNAGPVTFNMILDTVPPAKPTLAGYQVGTNPVSNLAVVDLSGTKEAGSSVLVDGVLAQNLSPTTWIFKNKRVPATGTAINIILKVTGPAFTY